MKQPRESERPEKERKLVLPGAPDRHPPPLGRSVFQRRTLHVSCHSPLSHKATVSLVRKLVWGQGFSLQSQSVEFRLGLSESRRPGSSDSQAGSREAGWRIETQLWVCGAMSRSRTTHSRQCWLPLLSLLWQQSLLLRLGSHSQDQANLLPKPLECGCEGACSHV